MNDSSADTLSGPPAAVRIDGLQGYPATLSPDRSLLTYYVLTSLLFGPFFVFALIPLYFRYRTLLYQIDEEGISMRWGILFHREVSLTYARIQDIHLSSNVVERWLGLGRVQVQTASGNADAEMTIEGLREHQEIRDFLYSRMRGARAGTGGGTTTVGSAPAATLVSGGDDELATALRAVSAEIRALRESLPSAARGGGDA